MQSKKFLRTIFLSLIVLIITTNYTTKAKEKIRLYVNQEEIASPIIMNDMTYVPIRFVAEALGAKVQWNQEKRQVDINSIVKVIASIPEKNIYLYAINNNNGGYTDLVLNIGDKSKVFNWENTSFPGFEPTLYLLDLNQDGKEELVIKLIEGHGTGFKSEKLHVININNFEEYTVKDPLKLIKDLVKIKINLQNNKVQIKFYDKIYTKSIKIEKEDFITFGHYIEYNLVDNILVATIPVQVSLTKYVGKLNIYYSFEDNEVKFNNIVYIE